MESRHSARDLPRGGASSLHNEPGASYRALPSYPTENSFETMLETAMCTDGFYEGMRVIF